MKKIIPALFLFSTIGLFAAAKPTKAIAPIEPDLPQSVWEKRPLAKREFSWDPGHVSCFSRKFAMGDSFAKSSIQANEDAARKEAQMGSKNEHEQITEAIAFIKKSITAVVRNGESSCVSIGTDIVSVGSRINVPGLLIDARLESIGFDSIHIQFGGGKVPVRTEKVELDKFFEF